MKELEVTFPYSGELQVHTEASVWRVRSDQTYQRVPRSGPRTVSTPCLDDALDDLEWHSFEQAWWLSDGGEAQLRLRILPVGRPPGSKGIITGLIEGINLFPEVSV